MAQHVKILGVLHIIYAGLVLLAGVIVMVVMGGIAGFLSTTGRASDSEVAPPILVFIGLCIFMFFVLLSLPGIIAGFGLLAFKEWSRILTIVLSALELLSVPFGTALGIYGLWVLLKPESEMLFRSAAPPPIRRAS